MQKLVRDVTLWAAMALLAAVMFGPIGQWFIQVATDKGYYAGAGTSWDAGVTWLLATLSSPVVRFAAVFAAGLFIGVRLDLLVRRRDARLGPLKEIRGKVFANEVVDIDGKHFIMCQFHSVRLRYAGGRYNLENNTFDGIPIIEPIGDSLFAYTVLLHEFDQLKRDVIGPNGPRQVGTRHHQ